MMFRLETMFTRRSVVAAVATVGMAASPMLIAQQQMATVHGHVQNAAGVPITTGKIQFTTDIHVPYKEEKFAKTVDLDKDGNYTAEIAPGEYFAYVLVNDKTPDQQHFTVKAGENTTVDFDMTRAEYIAKMTPEEK